MARIHTLEVEYKARCSAEKLYAALTHDAHKLPKYVPQMFHKVQVLPGDGEVRVGSVIVCEYRQGDTPFFVTTKEKITAVDHKNMSITYTISEGDVTKGYTSFANTLTITPTQRDATYNCLVKYSVQYEKANEDVPDATYVTKWLEDFIKELDTNLLKEQ